MARSVHVGTSVDPGSILLGKGTAVRRLRARLEQAIASAGSVLLRGESGTGKGLAARLIHDRWTTGGPLVHFKPSALDRPPLGEVLGELDARQGVTGIAGTLVVDDIGDADAATQSLLLDALAAGRRVLGVTRRDIETAVRRGSFAAELVTCFDATIWLPPIRARRDDVPDLVMQYCRVVGKAVGRPGVLLTPRALGLLAAQQWPGNIRQIVEVVEHLVLLARPGGTIDTEAVEGELAAASAQGSVQLGASSWAQLVAGA